MKSTFSRLILTSRGKSSGQSLPTHGEAAPALSPQRQTWRVRGVPPGIKKAILARALRDHQELHCASDEGNATTTNDVADNSAVVRTLTPDLSTYQVATVRFGKTPTSLVHLDSKSQLTIEIPISSLGEPIVEEHDSAGSVRLTLDRHFRGITVLSCPPLQQHEIDVLAISGLGSHPFGSFAHKIDGHMWLSDTLPKDMPMARVMIYGYESGLQRSNNFAHLGDLATSLKRAIYRLWSDTKRIVLIGHSLGGLLIKEAVIQIADENSDQLDRILGIIFFGVPNEGMSIESLIPMVGNQPNRFLLDSISSVNSQVLSMQKKDFFKVLERKRLEMFCFYETEESPTAQLNSNGKYEICGLRRCLVTPESAKGCLLPDKRGCVAPIARTHSELTKFALHDADYDNVRDVIGGMYRSVKAVLKPHYAVPLETVETYTQRDALWRELVEKINIRHEKQRIPHAVTICGLGGAGKSQLALKYIEEYKDRYNPILWIDATDKETVRSSFQRCAAKLKLPDGRDDIHGSRLADMSVIQTVLRWLRNKTEPDDEWLVVVDNADDVSWGIKDILPRGERGSIIITSRDNLSSVLVPGSERVEVGEMTAAEATTLLMRHLRCNDAAAEGLRGSCDEVVQRLGYLALAIDLAGAYIGNNPVPERALGQYLSDYEKHRDELLKSTYFQGLLVTEKTVWTVWDTTLDKIARDHGDHPGILLTLFAHFKGTIVEDEMFRLAALGVSLLVHDLAEKVPHEIGQFFQADKHDWDSFSYRQSQDVLVRYSLVQRVEGRWPGVAMHKLVQWRAEHRASSRLWGRWYTILVLAACCRQIDDRDKPEFQRHLIVHIPDVAGRHDWGGDCKECDCFMKTKFGRVFYEEGRWDEAEKLEVQVMEIRKTKLGTAHTDTLTSTANLASTYRNQGRWDEAETLEVEVMETRKAKFGADHPSTLTSMNNLASTLWNQGRWDEAKTLFMQVMEIRKTNLGADHPDTLLSIANLASTYRNQGRWDEAETLEVEVMKMTKVKLGTDHPYTLTIMANLASTYRNQGRWDEAKTLFIQVMESRKAKLGPDHPDTLLSIAYLASTLSNQGRWDEAEALEVEVMKMTKAKLGADHPSTLTSMVNLASTYRSQGRWDKAETLEAKVVETRKAKLGADHPDTLLSMANLALTLSNQGRWYEAELLEVEVMETRKAKLGANHPSTLTSMNNLAFTWKGLGRQSDALELLQSCVTARQRVLGQNHPYTLSSTAALEQWKG